ncbi:MAG: aldolase/citrate lyase family protein [Gammaproteobacteria bacterium]|nr:aldolase/citrate lyase family protein [Gammaproteobacteria bacterium]
MDLPRNTFKQALASGKTQYGLWLGLADTSVAEITASAGFDWLLIDHEHGPFELRDIMRHLQALAPYDVAPIVRPVEGNPALLKKLLDMGVQTFLVPMVDNADQAEALVQALRYPPAGRRGLGTSMARAARWNQVPGYVRQANEEICLIVQAETTSAMANLESILAVEGVDGVFIGPSDLSASMGHIGDVGHPDVVDAINKGLAAITAAGKYAGILCVDPALVAGYENQGASFIGVGVDTLLLSQGARQLARQFKGGGDGEDKPQAGY